MQAPHHLQVKASTLGALGQEVGLQPLARVLPAPGTTPVIRQQSVSRMGYQQAGVAVMLICSARPPCSPLPPPPLLVVAF